MCPVGTYHFSRYKDQIAEQHFLRAAELFNEGKMDGAIAELRASLRLNPNDPEAHYNLGLALREKGEADAAGRSRSERRDRGIPRGDRVEA